MTIQQIIAAIKADLAVLTAELGIFGTNLLTSINFAVMEKIAQDALLTGGPTAVIPALVANVAQYVANPVEAALVVIALRFAATWLGILSALQASGMGSHASVASNPASGLVADPRLAFSNVKPPSVPGGGGTVPETLVASGDPSEPKPGYPA